MYLHNHMDQDEKEEFEEAIEELEELEKDYFLKCKMIMDTIYTLKDIQKDMGVK